MLFWWFTLVGQVLWEDIIPRQLSEVNASWNMCMSVRLWWTGHSKADYVTLC